MEEILDSMTNNPSFKFVKTMFDDCITNENNLYAEVFTTLLNQKILILTAFTVSGTKNRMPTIICL